MPARTPVAPLPEDQVEARLREHAAKPPPRAAYLKRMGKLLERRNAGQSLTPRQERELAEFAAGQSTQPDAPAPSPDWLPSREKLAHALGCHPNSISRWLKEHADDPAIKTLHRPNGDWHLPGFRALIERHGINVAADAERDGGLESLGEIRRQQEIEKLEKLRRERRLADHELIPKAAAAQLLHDSHAQLKNLLRTIFEDEIPPLVAGLKAGAIRVHHKAANDRLCAEMQNWIQKLGAL